MKIIRGIKFGGLQQKIFSLVLIMILALIGVYTAVGLYIQKDLTRIVREASDAQQESIIQVSQTAMDETLQASITRNTENQATIADDIFKEVRSDVLTLKSFAEQIMKYPERFPEHPYEAPDAKKDGRAALHLMHEEGADPADSVWLPRLANMSETMLAMYESSERLGSCFVATLDGCILFVDDKAASYVSETGEAHAFPVSERPWYKQVMEEQDLIFTGVELESFTDIKGLVCAAPVYRNGEIVAIVGADIFLNQFDEYVKSAVSSGGVVFVVSENGQVLFSPLTEGIFQAEISAVAPDLRENENAEIATFIRDALQDRVDLREVTMDDGTVVYMSGAPLETLGWAIISVVNKEYTRQPTVLMLSEFESINADAARSFEKGTGNSYRMLLFLTVLILLLATSGAVFLSSRLVKPIEHMTAKMDELGAGDKVFEMEDIYRTGDEIEVMAESFGLMSKRTRSYIEQITQITAEKERIGTELALANQIQADMLPNIYPAFPDRAEFDIYASMTPAKEVGGDFYDFFLIDDTHLGLVMADVSGKGVPAALFMMISKILVQNYAMTIKSPAEVLRAVNDQICSNNREEMFVTVWFGVLDTGTGKIIAANAGHEYPAMMPAGGSFALIKDKHGFVIGGMEGVRYKEYEMQMTPGAKLFLYTDGVPEATNTDKKLFGTDRMIEALNKATGDTPEQVLVKVREAVDGFVTEAEQFDDLTMLCLEYKGIDAGK